MPYLIQCDSGVMCVKHYGTLYTEKQQTKCLLFQTVEKGTAKAVLFLINMVK